MSIKSENLNCLQIAGNAFGNWQKRFGKRLMVASLSIQLSQAASENLAMFGRISTCFGELERRKDDTIVILFMDASWRSAVAYGTLVLPTKLKQRYPNRRGERVLMEFVRSFAVSTY